MISFIIIGHNEEKNLKRCFNSIYNTVVFNHLQKFEIIYVDSKSVDRSIEIAKEFEDIKIFSITGRCNAAIARNIGARESSGDILFFIDGDMEIKKKFLSEVLDQEKELKYDFVSGLWVNVVESSERMQIPSGGILPGGIFLIRKELWESVNGMRTKYQAGEDGDLGLRLFKKGIPFFRKSEIIAKHYTIPYLDKRRIWKTMFNMSIFYSRCVLYRNHIFNKQMYYTLWNRDKTFILLIFIIIYTIVSFSSLPWCLLVYLLAVCLRSIKQEKYLSIFGLVLYFIALDVLNLIFLFTFFPKNKKVEYLKL